MMRSLASLYVVSLGTPEGLSTNNLLQFLGKISRCRAFGKRFVNAALGAHKIARVVLIFGLAVGGDQHCCSHNDSQNIVDCDPVRVRCRHDSWCVRRSEKLEKIHFE